MSIGMLQSRRRGIPTALNLELFVPVMRGAQVSFRVSTAALRERAAELSLVALFFGADDGHGRLMRRM
jgi:hypothetical protein